MPTFVTFQFIYFLFNGKKLQKHGTKKKRKILKMNDIGDDAAEVETRRLQKYDFILKILA